MKTHTGALLRQYFKKTALCLLLFVGQTSLHAQHKTSEATGHDYVKVVYNSLCCYTRIKDSLKQYTYSIRYDAMETANTEMVKRISDYGNLPPHKTSGLDAGFDLLKAFTGKVFCAERPYYKDFYYLKNDSTLVHKSLRRTNVWQLETEEDDKIYPIHLGNKKYIYWAYHLGIIYKEGGKLKTDFLALRYYYSDRSIAFMLKPQDSVNMNAGYFDFGAYQVTCKDANNYSISKAGKAVLNNVPLKYYNDQQLIAFDGKQISFYNKQMQADSQYAYRDMSGGWSNLEILCGNNIKRVNIKSYTQLIPENGMLGCGTVTWHQLHITGKEMSESTDASKTYGSMHHKKLVVQLPMPIDSMLFINRTNGMRWSVNGGFDNRIILFKDGKEGLYEFEQKETLITFKEILPILFDKIYLETSFVVLRKDGIVELLTEYSMTKSMRFSRLEYRQLIYLRYTKVDGTEGWMNRSGTLFDDL